MNPRTSLPSALSLPRSAIPLALGLLLWGCAKPPKVNYLEARPIFDPPPPPQVVSVPRPLPLPGQLKPWPQAPEVPSAKTKKGHRAHPKEARPSQLIDQANTHATRDPDEEGYFNAIMIYDFSPGALYQVYCAPLKITDIQLQPGETVLGSPACGDTVRWVLGFGTSKENGQSRQHIYLKPTRHGLETTLTINTNRRTYHLELHSTPSSYMAAMNFRYPEDELSKVSSQVQSAHEKQAAVTSTLVSLDRLNFHYDIETEGEEAEGFKPLKVFDDGQKTFIQFPQRMRYHEAPALFIVAEDKTLQIVNYRKKNDFYIVDRLFKRAELRLGQKDPARVRITRHGG